VLWLEDNGGSRQGGLRGEGSGCREANLQQVVAFATFDHELLLLLSQDMGHLNL